MPNPPIPPQTIPARADIARETTWDTASLFASPADWQTAFDALGNSGAEIAAVFANRLGESPDVLADYFAQSEAVLQKLSRVFIYASLTYSVDTSDGDAVARYDKARGLYARTLAALAFVEPELLSIGAETLQKWANENRAALGGYAHYFDTLSKREAHVRTAEVETLLKALADPFGSAASIHGVLTNTDLVFAPAVGGEGDPHEIGQGTINKLLADSDRNVRRTAWENYADAHIAHQNTLAACLATGVKQNVFMARARGYGSALEAALAPNHIPVEVFHNLLRSFQANLPTWHKYWEIRRRALGLEKLAGYDIRAALTGDAPAIPYAQAVEWIAGGMAPLGADYVSALQDGATTERWVDVYPNKGKRMGAFSSGGPGTKPFIMMSYNDDLAGLSTLAHELGHSLHSYFTWKTQPFVYGRYGLFAAEVASNFNQALVRAHLMERFKNDKTFQIALLEEAMGNFHRYFFVMPTLARFEQEIHERVWRGDALTAPILNDLMADLFGEAFGPSVQIDRARIGSIWMQFSTHLYANFYVFQYATGISGAHALASRVLQNGDPAAQNYLGFLKAGGSRYPLDALKNAGVDLASSAPVDETFAVMAGYIERLGELLNV